MNDTSFVSISEEVRGKKESREKKERVESEEGV